MPRKNKDGDAGTPEPPVEGSAWEERHEHDAGGPLAANASGISDRSTRNPLGSAGEPPVAHQEGYRQITERSIPNLGPAPAPWADDSIFDEEMVRRRAHQIWEREGRPEGQQDAHWHAAREELEREARTG